MLLRKSLLKLLDVNDFPIQFVESDTIFSTIRAIEVENPDVLILDLRMPGGSGLDVLNYLRSKGKTIRTIVLTNQNCNFYREQCLDLGADYFFDKALEFERVREVLAETDK